MSKLDYAASRYAETASADPFYHFHDGARWMLNRALRFMRAHEGYTIMCDEEFLKNFRTALEE